MRRLGQHSEQHSDCVHCLFRDKLRRDRIKVFVLADARNGYVYRMQIYTSNLDSEVGLCSRVVLELIEGLEHTGPSIYG